MKKWVFFIFAICLYCLPAAAATLSATVNRNPVPVGETFILTVKYDDNPQNQKPDFSALEKDFIIYSLSSSVRSSYVNGKYSQFYQWDAALMPKNAGKIIIPPLKLGKSQSQPITLTVSDEGADSANVTPNAGQSVSGSKISFVGTIDNPRPLVQQQVNYTLVLKTPVLLQGETPQFVGENNGDWIIRLLGKPEVNTEIENGQEIYNIKFSYALFPQKSGLLTLPPVQFDGFYVTYNNGRQPVGDSFFTDAFSFSSMFGQRHPVRLQTKPIEVEVAPVPKINNGNWWLPVSQLSLTSDWQRQMPEFKSGEAVKREIYLEAVGAVESQLPTIEFAEIAGVKQYPEKPQYVSEVRNGQIVSSMKVTNVYIPHQAGRIVIPETAVSWYNINSGKMEKSVLPATEVRVWPGKENSGGTAVLPSAETNKTENNGASPANVPVAPANSHLLWLAVGGAFGLGIALSYFWFRPRVAAAAKADAPVCSDIQVAARNNNLHEIRNSVLDWGKREYGIHNLNDLASRIGNPEFAAALEDLNRALYSGKTVNFNVSAFTTLFNKISKNKRKAAKTEKILPDLYKK